MTPFRTFLIVSLALFVTGLHASEVPWDLAALKKAPVSTWGAREGAVQEVYFPGEVYRGKPTRVFAYVGRPEGKGPFPGIVLVHGGGGQAYKNWAALWAKRGYVAIAMDLSGNGPGKVRLPDGGPGLGNATVLNVSEGSHDGWTYHAVAAVIRSHSLLRSLPEVDPNRTGITGISWGGYVTCIVAGLDGRLKVSVPVYGGGFLSESSWWKSEFFDPMTAEQRASWVRRYDPSRYLGQVTHPILFINSPNDPRFFFDSHQRSYQLVKPELRYIATLPGIKHGHIWTFGEVDRFIDAALAGGAPAPRFGEVRSSGVKAHASFKAEERPAKAELYFTTDAGPWVDRKWQVMPATLRAATVAARLPDGRPLSYFFSVTDKHGLKATSEYAEVGGAAEDAITSAAKTGVTNSLGMELMKIHPGRFVMGEAQGARWMEGGEWDESPVRKVEISQPFFMGATEVTNAQYEQFAPGHRALRGKKGFSKDDDEPVIFVSWHEAVAFCKWLSAREGKPYRLPTEAEWEYACRAGASTAYSTGVSLPADQLRAQSDYVDHRTSHQTPVSLRVRQAAPNAWGLYDLHGNVEEWCHDWYGPYESTAAVDPVGRISGYARVTRGGSHNTDVYYLRSANRLSALPEDRSYYIGFRVVQAPLPATNPRPLAPPTLVESKVSQVKNLDAPAGYSAQRPHFIGPRYYVKVPEQAQQGPLFWFHNHDPAMVYCDNGDLLAIWYSTQREWGRELTVLGSRLRAGHDSWDEASLFFDLADRNDHAPAFWRDSAGKLYHFNGTGVGGWGGLNTFVRTSTDNGATWSHPHLMKADRTGANGCVESVIKTRVGRLFVPVDGDQSTEVLLSDDDGKTWRNPADGKPQDKYTAGATGHRIAGIHAALVELANGDLFAIGRGSNIEGRCPVSLSRDGGETWTYSASDFPPVRAGQRFVLKRLNEGPLLVVTFTDHVVKHAQFELGVQRERVLSEQGIEVIDAAGKTRRVFGMFAALSFDEGKTWPVKKLITPGGKPHEYFGHGWTKKFTTDDTHAEPMGYLAATQTPDGRIHLISSALHYEFNLSWLNQPMPAATP